MLTADFLSRGMIPPSALKSILTDSVRRFNVMACDYEKFAGMLEDALLTDPESVERIVRHARSIKLKLRLPENNYIDALGDDPNRKLRLTPPASRPLPAKLQSDSVARRYHHPGWAFLYVSTHAEPEMTNELVACLRKSDEYAYLAAKLLRIRDSVDLPMGKWMALLDGITSPRWAFHAMRDISPIPAQFEGTYRRLLGIVHKSPPWAVLFWQVRHFAAPVLKLCYASCLASAPEHECLPELHTWYRMALAMSAEASDTATRTT